MFTHASFDEVNKHIIDGNVVDTLRSLQKIDESQLNITDSVVIARHTTACQLVHTFQLSFGSPDERQKFIYAPTCSAVPNSLPTLPDINMESLINTIVTIDRLISQHKLYYQNDANRVHLLTCRAHIATTILKCINSIAIAAAKSTSIDNDDINSLLSTYLALSPATLQNIMSLISYRHTTLSTPSSSATATNADKPLISAFNSAVQVLNTLASRVSSLASSPFMVMLRLRSFSAWVDGFLATHTQKQDSTSTDGNVTENTIENQQNTHKLMISASFLSTLSLLLRTGVLASVAKDINSLTTLRSAITTTDVDNINKPISPPSPIDPFCEADSQAFLSFLQAHQHPSITVLLLLSKSLAHGVHQLLRMLQQAPELLSLSLATDAAPTSSSISPSAKAASTMDTASLQTKPFALATTPFFTVTAPATASSSSISTPPPTPSAEGISSKSLFTELATVLSQALSFSTQTASILSQSNADHTQSAAASHPAAVDISAILSSQVGYLVPLRAAAVFLTAPAAHVLHILSLMTTSSFPSSSPTSSISSSSPTATTAASLSTSVESSLPPLAVPAPPLSALLRARVALAEMSTILAPDAQITALLRGVGSNDKTDGISVMKMGGNCGNEVDYGDLSLLLARTVVNIAVQGDIAVGLDTVRALYRAHKSNISQTLKNEDLQSSEFSKFSEFLSYITRSPLETVLYILWQGCATQPHVWAPILCSLGNIDILSASKGQHNGEGDISGVKVPLKVLLSSVIANCTRAYQQMLTLSLPTLVDWRSHNHNIPTSDVKHVDAATSTITNSPVLGPDLLGSAAEGWGLVSSVVCMCVAQEMEHHDDNADVKNDDRENCDSNCDNHTGVDADEEEEEKRDENESANKQTVKTSKSLATVELLSEEEKIDDDDVKIPSTPLAPAKILISSLRCPTPQPLRPLLSLLRGIALDACLPGVIVYLNQEGDQSQTDNDSNYEIACPWLDHLFGKSSPESEHPEDTNIPDRIQSHLHRMHLSLSMLSRLAQTHAPAAAELLLMKTPLDTDHALTLTTNNSSLSRGTADATALSSGKPSFSLLWASISLLISQVDAIAITAHDNTTTTTTTINTDAAASSLASLLPSLTHCVAAAASVISPLASVSAVRNGVVQSGLHTSLALLLARAESIGKYLASRYGGVSKNDGGDQLVASARDLPLRIILGASGRLGEIPESEISLFPKIFLEAPLYCASALGTIAATQVSFLTRAEARDCVRYLSSHLLSIVGRAVECLRLDQWNDRVCTDLVALSRVVIEALLYLTAVPNVRSEIITSSLVHAILALIGVTPTALAPPPLGKKLDFRNVAEIPVPRCLLLSEAVLRDGPCRYGLLRVWLNLLVCEEDVKREENVDASVSGLKQAASKGLNNPLSSNPSSDSEPSPPSGSTSNDYYPLQYWCVASGALRGVAAVRAAYKRDTIHQIADVQARNVVLNAVFKNNTVYKKHIDENSNDSTSWSLPDLETTSPLYLSPPSQSSSSNSINPSLPRKSHVISDPVLGTKFSNNLLIPLQHASTFANIYTSVTHINAKADFHLGNNAAISLPVAHREYPCVNLPTAPLYGDAAAGESSCESVLGSYLPTTPQASLFSTAVYPSSNSRDQTNGVLPHTHAYALLTLPQIIPALNDTLSEMRVLQDEVQRRTTEGEDIKGSKKPHVKGATIRPQMYYDPGLLTPSSGPPQAPSMDTMAAAAVKIRDRAVAALSRLLIYIEPTVLTSARSVTPASFSGTNAAGSGSVSSSAVKQAGASAVRNFRPSCASPGLGLSADAVKKLGKAVVALLRDTSAQVAMHECFMGLTSLVTHPDASIAISLIVDEEESPASPSPSPSNPKLHSTLLNTIADSIYGNTLQLQVSALELLTNMVQYAPVGMLLCGLREENTQKAKNAKSGVPAVVAKADLVRMIFLMLSDTGSDEINAGQDAESQSSRALMTQRQVVCGSIIAMLSDTCEFNALTLSRTLVKDHTPESSSNPEKSKTSPDSPISGLALVKALCIQFQRQQQQRVSPNAAKVSPDVYQRCAYALERMMRAEQKAEKGLVLKDLWDMMN